MTSMFICANSKIAFEITMPSRNKTYDVFISHSACEAPLAAELANACRAGGLETATDGELSSARDAGDAVREAVVESWAFVAVISKLAPTPTMNIEIGAAWGWNKPMFVIVTEPSVTQLPAPLTRAGVYPPERIGDVIAAIKSSGRQITDDDRAILAEVYRAVGVPVDELALDEEHMQDLVKRFKARARKKVSEERLLSELFRMRKQGRLSKNRAVR